jgi:Rhodopirellula transposase DDE domain
MLRQCRSPYGFPLILETVSSIKHDHIVVAKPKIKSFQSAASLSPEDLVKEQIADIRMAAAKMSGPQRRDFMAEISLKYCMGNARLTESTFKWSRISVSTGLGEKRTGLICIGLQTISCGNNCWEEKHPEIAEYLCKIAENQSQQDPTFESTIAFTRLTAPSALSALSLAGFCDDDLPSRSSMVDILDRLGYRLRKVVKAKPLKKIAETDAIFENVKKKIKNPKSQVKMLQE